jgi:hypothetical protein
MERLLNIPVMRIFLSCMKPMTPSRAAEAGDYSRSNASR